MTNQTTCRNHSRSPNLKHLLDITIAAVREGGAMLRDEFLRPDGPRGADSKADVDTEIEWLLREQLLHAFPARYRGEETGWQPPAPGAEAWCWLVDPHDGTSAFLKGYRGSAVSVALLRDGVPVLGVVYAPLSPDRGEDLIAWAEGCGPLTRNGIAVDVDLRDRRLQAGEIVFISQAAPRRPMTNAALCAQARFIGLPSIAYRLARVAAGDGIVGVSLNGPQDWDYAAGHALLRGVGGVLLDDRGRPVTYRRDGSSQCGGACFGGAPAAASVLAGRPWNEVFKSREAESRPRVSLTWPRHADDETLRRATGVLLGQCIGDSLGSLVEFRSPGEIARKYPAGVRDLADGGTWNTLAGQPTDDSELAILLARSLLARRGYDEEFTANFYATWYASGPFDVGNTTRDALSAALTARKAKRSVAEAAVATARDSVPSNGSLMRVSPIGIFAVGHPQEAARLARIDSALTHGNPVCLAACAAYASAIAVGVAGGDRHAMLSAARSACGDDAASVEVLDALARAEAGDFPHAFGKHQGGVLVALQIAFRQLVHADDFEQALVETVGLGGDTDTNGAITGALLGACHSRDAIPSRWVLPVLACRPMDDDDVARPRPDVVWPDDVVELAEGVLGAGIRPTDGRCIDRFATRDVAMAPR